MALGEERDLVPLGAGFDITKRGYSRMQVEDTSNSWTAS
jgi:hypothetical protein